jgi:hypothetical protein
MSSISNRASGHARKYASAETLRQRSRYLKLSFGTDSPIPARPQLHDVNMIEEATVFSVCPQIMVIETGRAIAGAP